MMFQEQTPSFDEQSIESTEKRAIEPGIPLLRIDEHEVFSPESREADLKEILSQATIDPLSLAESLLKDTRFRQAFLDLANTGTHPLSNDFSWYDPFTDTTKTSNNSNIGEHVVSVALVANTLVTHAIAAGILTEADREEAVTRALLHDVVKIPERIIQKAKEQGDIPDAQFHGQDKHLLSYFLGENGFSESDAQRLSSYGAECGHHSVSKFLVPDGDSLRLDVSDTIGAIVHLADDLVSTSLQNDKQKSETRILAFEERAICSEFEKRYPFLFTEGLGFSSGDRALSPVNDISNPQTGIDKVFSYYTAQWLCSEGIARFLQKEIDPGSTKAPGQFIQSLVMDSLNPQ